LKGPIYGALSFLTGKILPITLEMDDTLGDNMDTDKAKAITQEQTKKIEKAVPQSAPDNVVMNLEATVDATPQKLRTKIKSLYKAQKDIPKLIPAEAQIVLQCLFSCFDKQRKISEGLVKDIIWGFEQSGIPQPASLVGLKQLENLGYISFNGPDGGKVSIFSDRLPDLWVKYEDKLLDLVYEE
jgi:hypothetical protein